MGFRKKRLQIKPERFKNIEHLLGGYFHQDRDVVSGSSVEEVIAAFRSCEQKALWTDVRREITTYLAEHPDDAELTSSFYEMFSPEIVEGCYGTTREFLTRIVELLSA